MSRKQIEIIRNLWHIVVRTSRRPVATSRLMSRRRPPPPASPRRAGYTNGGVMPTIHPTGCPGPGRPAGPSAEGQGDHRPGHRGHPTTAADRVAVVGVRELRDAVQGVRAEGRAARPLREGRRRGPGPSLHRRRADGRPPHPVGQGRRLRGPGAPRHGPRRRPRHDQLEHVPGRRLHARQRLPPGSRASAARRSTTCSSASTSWTRPGRRTSSCGSRTARTTPARTTSAVARSVSPSRWRSTYERLGPDQRIVLEYKFFEPAFYATDVPDWGTALLHCLALGDRAKVVLDTGHHAPGTNIEFIVAQLLRVGRLGGVRLQLAVLCRRRPDGRRGGPVPAVPDHARGRHRWRPGARDRASSSCSTSATTSSRRSRPRSAR